MMVWLKACPMCSVPVTLGGGDWMTKGSAWRPACGWTCWPPLKWPPCSQRAYQRDSISWGSKLLDNWSSEVVADELVMVMLSVLCARAVRRPLASWAKFEFKTHYFKM